MKITMPLRSDLAFRHLQCEILYISNSNSLRKYTYSSVLLHKYQQFCYKFITFDFHQSCKIFFWKSDSFHSCIGSNCRVCDKVSNRKYGMIIAVKFLGNFSGLRQSWSRDEWKWCLLWYPTLKKHRFNGP